MIVLYIIIGLLIAWGLAGIRIVRPTDRGVIEWMGRYQRFAKSGFNWVFFPFQTLYFQNITEQMMDIAPQEVITKERLNTKVDMVVFYQVKSDEISVKRSLYNVDEFERQITRLAQTTARSVIGEMSFEKVNSNRKELNEKLRKSIDKESDAWGVRVVRVETKEIQPPQDVQNSMNEVLKAENEKKAAIDLATATETKADGARRAAIKEASGKKDADILEAEGIGKGKVIVAKAKAEAIKNIHLAAQKYFKKDAQKLKQFEVAENAFKDNSKIILGDNAKGVFKLLNLDK